MLKKFIICGLILGLILGLGGCSAVTCMSISYVDGSFGVDSVIVLDKENLAQENVAYDDMVAYLNDCANDYWRILGGYFATENAQFKAKVNSSTDDYQISISFENVESYKEFTKQPKDASSSSSPNVEKHFLISKNILLDTSQGGGALLDTLIRLMERNYVTIENITLEKSINQVYLESFCNRFGMSEAKAKQFLSQINFKLVYAFEADERIRSNANSFATLVAPVGLGKDEKAIYTAHVYNCQFGAKLPDIILYRNCLTRENVIEWYVLAIGVSAAFGLILWLALYLQAKHKNKYNPKRENNGNFSTNNVNFDNSLGSKAENGNINEDAK